MTDMTLPHDLGMHKSHELLDMQVTWFPHDLTHQHVPVSLVGDGIDVRWHLVTLLPTIQLHHFLGVDGVQSVRVDHHTEQARVGLDGRGNKVKVHTEQGGVCRSRCTRENKC